MTNDAQASSSPHLRRLQADYQAMQRLVATSPFIRMVVIGEPPHRYRITYHCRGLVRDTRDGAVKASHRHVADIYLHADYPRLPPTIIWRTPIFHPNIRFSAGGGTVCLQTWTPSRSLADLVHLVGRMVQYHVYDTQHAIDWQAARWARSHRHLLPVDPRPLVPRQSEPGLVPSSEASP